MMERMLLGSDYAMEHRSRDALEQNLQELRDLVWRLYMDGHVDEYALILSGGERILNAMRKAAGQ